MLNTPSTSWNRKWQSIPVSLLGKFHGQWSLAGYSPWGHKDLDMTQHACTPSTIPGDVVDTIYIYWNNQFITFKMFSSFNLIHWLKCSMLIPFLCATFLSPFYHISTTPGPPGRHLTIVIFDKIAAKWKTIWVRNLWRNIPKESFSRYWDYRWL